MCQYLQHTRTDTIYSESDMKLESVGCRVDSSLNHFHARGGTRAESLSLASSNPLRSLFYAGFTSWVSTEDHTGRVRKQLSGRMSIERDAKHM